MLTRQDPTLVAAPAVERRGRRYYGLALVGVLVACILVGAALQFKRSGQLPFLHRESVWSVAIYAGPSPFELAPTNAANTPVLTARDVSDVPALFVADPFMVRSDGTWYMFFEVLNQNTDQGDIGLATSDNGLTWKYQQLVVDEPFHMSYPSVFQLDGKWYMLPETEAAGCVQLYEASEFPRHWRRVQTLMRGPQLADPTLFQHGGKWWLFVGRSHTHDSLRLFFAADLFGDWTEHPRSPLIVDNPEIARPGGPVRSVDGQWYRFAQDCSPRYGNQLRAFRITTLTTTDYAEESLAAPVLTAGTSGWNAIGMHHADAHQLPDGSWRAAVDGHTKTWVWRSTP